MANFKTWYFLTRLILFRDPALWRSAILYYSVYKASQMSFAELFQDLGKFVESPEVRWDYCLRCKRGQYDTSKPGKTLFKLEAEITTLFKHLIIVY